MDCDWDDLIDDCFDSVLDLEAHAGNEGRAAGMRAGLKSGGDEGFKQGCLAGRSLAEELGHYHGCLLAWEFFIAHQEEEVPAGIDVSLPPACTGRTQKKIAALLELFDSDDLRMEPESDEMAECVEKIRSGFRQVNAVMKGPQRDRVVDETDF